MAPPRPTLGHWQQGNLTYSMVNTLLFFTWNYGHQEPHNKVGSLSPAKYKEGSLPILNATPWPIRVLSSYPLCDMIKWCCNMIGQEHSGVEHHNVNSKQWNPFNEQWLLLKFEKMKSTKSALLPKRLFEPRFDSFNPSPEPVLPI